MSRAAVVGSGPNGLAAALTLAAAGLQVTVYEAADRLGGGVRSTDLTLPGLIHDDCAAAHPLAVDTPFSRRFALESHGLIWCWPEVQYSHPLDAGRGGAAYRSVADTATGLPASGGSWASVFGPLNDSFDALAEDIFRPTLHVPAHPLKLAHFGALSALPASVLARRFGSQEGQALFAGVAAHAFRPLGSAMSSAVGLVLGTAAHHYGWPVAHGGSGAITAAMVSAARQLDVRFETGVRVESLAALGQLDAVMLDTSPRAAVSICGSAMPGGVARALRRFRYGPGAFKLDLAVEGGIPWAHEPSHRAGTVHVGGTLKEIAAAEAMVARRTMPERPFVLVCQQYLADPSRSAGNVHPVYAYAHVPAGWDGDASDAIESQIERYAPGFRERILARHVRSVSELESYNANYIGGDIATGANDPRQMLFRPRAAVDPYSLGIPGVYLCSAATPPGAGAHGICGYNAANSALRHLG